MFLNCKVFVRLESTPEALFQSDAVKYAFVGLMRDLRGIAMATNRLALIKTSETLFCLQRPCYDVNNVHLF